MIIYMCCKQQNNKKWQADEQHFFTLAQIFYIYIHNKHNFGHSGILL